MPDQSSITIADFDGQLGIFGMNCDVLTAANFATQMGLLTDVRTSLAAIIDGVAISEGVSHRTLLQASGYKASDENAQRGNKWLVHANDTTNELAVGVPNPYHLKPFTYEIPTADLDLRVDHKNEVWVLGGANNVAAFDNFIDAFEAFAKSPVGGDLEVHLIEAITASGG